MMLLGNTIFRSTEGDSGFLYSGVTPKPIMPIKPTKQKTTKQKTLVIAAAILDLQKENCVNGNLSQRREWPLDGTRPQRGSGQIWCSAQPIELLAGELKFTLVISSI